MPGEAVVDAGRRPPDRPCSFSRWSAWPDPCGLGPVAGLGPAAAPLPTIQAVPFEGCEYGRFVKYGLFAINYGTCANPEHAVRVAQHAEAAGFESVWTGEHLVLPDPQPDSFSMPPTLPFIDTIVALTQIAAETRTINVASGIIELPLHHPVMLAKQLASIDHISHGRLIVGVGAGYVEAEFAAMGVDLAERGVRMDEHIDAMRALWTMDDPQYFGRVVQIDGVNAFPRPFVAADPRS